MEKGTHTAYLLLGGNLGNRMANLAAARSAIGAGAPIRRASQLYETAAWGLHDQPDFLNQVLEVETTLTPRALLDSLLAIESGLGRERLLRNGPRPIDIDILFYDDVVLEEPGLSLPHPRLQERRFVLTPLKELAPGFRHPVLGLTVAELLAACSDPLPVNNFRGA